MFDQTQLKESEIILQKWMKNKLQTDIYKKQMSQNQFWQIGHEMRTLWMQL